MLPTSHRGDYTGSDQSGSEGQGADSGTDPPSTESWVLVGGQMMLVLAVEFRAERVRPIGDIDVVVNVRVRRDGSQRGRRPCG